MDAQLASLYEERFYLISYRFHAWRLRISEFFFDSVLRGNKGGSEVFGG